jgi:hypothetical protein
MKRFCSQIFRRYVLSPTHLHEFKSADRIYTQPPVMSLLLSDQKLGSHAQPGSSSYKFGNTETSACDYVYPANPRSDQGTPNWVDA